MYDLYIYIHTYTYIHLYKCIWTKTHQDRARIHLYCVCVYVRACLYGCTCVRMCVCACARLRACVCFFSGSQLITVIHSHFSYSLNRSSSYSPTISFSHSLHSRSATLQTHVTPLTSSPTQRCVCSPVSCPSLCRHTSCIFSIVVIRLLLSRVVSVSLSLSLFLSWYGVATISRMLKNICLFAEYRSLL